MSHLEHPEDLLLTKGLTGAKTAIKHLRSIKEALNKSGHLTDVTQKWDGKMALFFGWDPEDNRFFVSTKSVFSKNPVLIKSTQDAENHPVSAIRKDLLTALLNLPKITPAKGDTVWQGDLLYTKDMLHTSADQITFTPNTITYSVDVDSNLGKFIQDSSMGIIIHTKYNSLKSMDSPIFNPSLRRFRPSKYVWFSNATITKGEESTLKERESDIVEDLLNAAEEKIHRVSPKLFSILTTLQISSTLSRAVNHLVRSSHITPNTLPQDLYDMLSDFLRKTLAKSKLGLQRITQMTINYKDDFALVLESYLLLVRAKTILIRALEKNEHEIKSINTKPEGFVSVKKGSTVKLVDRAEFSRLNFRRHDAE